METIRTDRHYHLRKTEVLRDRKYSVIHTPELNIYDLIDIVNEVKAGKLKNKITFIQTDTLTPTKRK